MTAELDPWFVNRQAANTVYRKALSEADKQDLYEMCGLVEPGAHRLLPDDTKVYSLSDVGKAPGAKDPDAQTPLAFADHGRRPAGMTTPPGLANLPPIEVVPPKPARELPPCGTRRRYNAHKKAGEECAECRDANNTYFRDYQAAQRAAKKASA